MAKQYPVHKDLKKWTYTHLDLEENKVLRLQGILGKLYDIQKTTKELAVQKYRIKTPDGEFLRMILYTPAELRETESPCLIVYHGGGFVLPAFPHHFRLAREYAKKAKCRVLFAEYRLAPRWKFPIAPKDGFHAYQWLLKHAKSFQIDPKHIVVSGDSAGGEIATDVCLMALRHDLQLPVGQMLIYPAVSKGLKTESMKLYVDTPMCNSKDVEIYEKYYVDTIKEEEWEFISPIDSDLLASMPPCYIETAEFDCLRDAAIMYAEKLKLAGVDTELYNTKQTMHAYDIEKRCIIVEQSIQKRIAFLEKMWNK